MISEMDENYGMFILDEDDCIISNKNKELIGQPIGNIIKKTGKIENNRRKTAEIDDKEVLFTAAVDKRGGWKVVSVLPVELMRHEINQTLFNLIMFMILSIVSAGVLSAVVTKMFTQRIERLTGAVLEMKEGELGIQVSENGDDEVGMLEKAFSEMSSRIKYLIDEVYQKELIKRAAEYNLLQEQVKPHFLYNVLSSITAMAMRSGDTKTIEMVEHLSEFYRISLNKGKNIITVQEEVNLLKHYLEIQKVRFGDTIQVSYELDGSLMACVIPKLILQPVVENAIHHGRRENEELFHISVTLKEEEGNLLFTVMDNGIGMSEEMVGSVNKEIMTATEGFGLKNIAIRIQMQYGEKYGLDVTSKQDKGTTIRIWLPVQYK